MFSFKFDNGICSYKVQVPNGFTRIGSTKGYYLHNWTIDNVDENALEHEMRYDTYAMYSYLTPICMVKVVTNETTKRLTVLVYLNEDSYNCSQSTRRQLGRFLQDVTTAHNLGYGLTYYNLKNIMKSVRMHFFYDATDYIECYDPNYYRDSTLHVWRMNTDEISDLFNDYPKPIRI